MYFDSFAGWMYHHQEVNILTDTCIVQYIIHIADSNFMGYKRQKCIQKRPQFSNPSTNIKYLIIIR